MKSYYRWAVLASTAVFTFAGGQAAWADTATGGTVDTAITVPALSGVAEGTTASVAQPAEPYTENLNTAAGNGTTAGSGTGTGSTAANPGEAAVAQNGTAAAQTEAAAQTGTAATQTETTNGTTETSSGNRIIRVGNQTGTGSSGSATTGSSTGTGTQYYEGPGAAGQSTAQSGTQAGTTSAAGGVNLATASGDVLIYELNNPVVKMTDKYSYDQMSLDINTLKSQYGSKLTVNVIGTSLDGRSIYDCIVGNPSAPKQILIQGGIHAREYLNPMLMMQQMELALANYDVGSFTGNPLSSMFNQVAIHFVPMSNPDGVTISQFGPDGIRSQTLKDALSTCYVMDTAAGRTSADAATYFSRWKANAQGVDLNLNFDAIWPTVHTCGFPSYSGYKGAAPSTEPETQALMNLYNDTKYHWVATISYHSMGNVIYWDIAGNKIQGDSLQLAQLMSNVTGGYRILPSEGGGGFKDWVQLGTNPVPSVTLETGTSACPMSLSEYPAIWARNRVTWAYALAWGMGR